MHNLKPNTDYRIVEIRLAIPADIPEDEVADGISELLNSAIRYSEAGNGCIDDWAYRGDASVNTYEDLPLKRTSREPEEGEVFT